MDKVNEKYMPWYSLGAPPGAQYLSYYGHHRCQEANPHCPYCDEVYFHSCGEGVSVDCVCCPDCHRDFEITASMNGFGYSTYPIKCENREQAEGHDFVFATQYEHNGELWRIFKCVGCEKTKYHTKPAKGNMMLPWLDEYNDPDYFDPEGILK